MTTIHYLEMLDRRQFRPTPPPAGFRVERLVPAQPDRNRWFYEAVGRDWQWTDRLVWTDDDWRRYAERPALQTWIGRYYGQEAGYFELEIQQTDVQIAYFGLLPEFIGQGLGGGLLSEAIRRAWAVEDAGRVWVHTCTDDHPGALPNYQQRGFTVYKTRQV
jgi:GNAT superfamily N-acetyltransferase